MSAATVNQPVESTDPFHLEGLGIGGLQTEFGVVFRRALASRLYPKHLVDQLGIRHVRGILLSGPAGTGKTLVARRIGDILNSSPAKIINVPELLSRPDIDASLQHIFGAAEAEQKEKGDHSQLHLIIFDSLEALHSTSKADVVEKLLAKVDDPAPGNVLLVGLTTRKDLVDPGFLRPGRFDVQVEIGLPGKESRAEIFKVHTRELRAKNLLSADVNLEALAAATEGFTGAEIDAVVREASAIASKRAESAQVTPSDFQLATEAVKPKGK